MDTTLRLSFHVFATFVLGSACAAQKRPSVIESAWRVREGIPSDTLGGTFRNTSWTQRGDTVAIVGDVIRDGSPNSPSFTTSVVWLSPGGRVELPPHSASGFHKAIYDRTGRLHVVWGEIYRGDVETLPWIPTVALWHTSRDGSGWTKPEEVVRGNFVNWTDKDGLLSLDSKGRLHLLVGVMDAFGVATVDFRRDSINWSRRNVGPVASFASIAALPSGTLLAAMVTSTSADTPPRVRLSRSTDDGDSWSQLSDVSRPSDSSVSFSSLVVAGSRAFVVWTESAPLATVAQLYIAQSTDDGRNWSTPDGIGLSSTPRRLTVAADGCGGGVALLELRIDANQPAAVAIFEVQWGDHAVVAMRRLFSDYLSVFDSVIASRGKLLLARFVRSELTGTFNMEAERAACVSGP